MITKEKVRHLAELARLKLKDEEIEALTQDLNQILNYVEKIKELDLKNIEPLINILQKLPFREDQSDSETNEDILSLIKENFPQKDGDYLKVPKILEK